LAVALLLIATSGTAAVGADPEVILYNGGPQHTGVYDTEPLRELRGLKWKFETVGEVTAPPLVHDGVVYFGDWEDHFYAVDRRALELQDRRRCLLSAAHSGRPRLFHQPRQALLRRRCRHG